MTVPTTMSGGNLAHDDKDGRTNYENEEEEKGGGGGCNNDGNNDDKD